MEKLLLGSAHDTYPVYEYCRLEDITPFIDLNPGHTGHFTYEDDFTINDNGIPVYKLSLCIHKDEYEAAKHRGEIRQAPLYEDVVLPPLRHPDAPTP